MSSGRKIIRNQQDTGFEPALSLKEKTAKGLFWGAVSSGVQQVITLIFGIYFARKLDSFDYGLLGLLAIFAGISNALINSGFSTALVNKKDATDADYNAVFWFSTLAGVFLYIILFFSAPLIAQFFGKSELTALSRVVFLGFVFSGIGIVPYTIMFKKLMTRQQAIVGMLSLLISCLVCMVLIMNGFRYWALAVENLLFIAIGVVMRCFFAGWRPRLHLDFTPLRTMFAFSGKLLITSIFTVVNTNIFAVILGKFYHVTDVGNYNQGQKWMTMGNTFISNMIGYVTQPVLVQINQDKSRQVSVLRKLIRFGAFVSFPLMLGLAFVGREFIVITVTERWLPAVPFLQLFCIWGAFSFLWTLFTNLIYTQGQSNIFMKVSVGIGLLQLLTVILLSRFGIYPMVVGYILAYFAGLLFWQHNVRLLIGLRLRDVLRDIFPYLVITLFCFGTAWLLTLKISNIYLLFALKIVLSGILYIFALKMLNSVIFRESLEFLKNRKKGT